MRHLLLLGLFLTSCAYVSAADQEARLLEFDDDGDGFADIEAGGTDCDDADPDTFPGAVEVCDGKDQDCDGVDDDGLLVVRWLDADGDGAGDPEGASLACPDEEGFVSRGDDCDDSDDAVYPGAEERCNELDDDCDRAVDEDAGTLWHPDRDGDGYGDAIDEIRACTAPEGWVEDATDCHDGEATAYPGATEICDDLDNDCDGSVDEDGDSEVSWFEDADGDGWGTTDSVVQGCVPPAGFVRQDGDCDDSADDVYPGAREPSCDGIDHNCDGDPNDPSRALDCE